MNMRQIFTYIALVSLAVFILAGCVSLPGKDERGDVVRTLAPGLGPEAVLAANLIYGTGKKADAWSEVREHYGLFFDPVDADGNVLPVAGYRPRISPLDPEHPNFVPARFVPASVVIEHRPELEEAYAAGDDIVEAIKKKDKK